MRKTIRWTMGLFLLAALGTSRAGVDLSRFYAKRVIDQINVNGPENALGEPDGRFAEIKPGGEMTVDMEKALFSLDGSDDGQVVTRGNETYGLAGLFVMNEEGQAAWQPLAPGADHGGFNLSPMRSVVGQTTRTIRIVNDDAHSVYLDAVIGFGAEQ